MIWGPNDRRTLKLFKMVSKGTFFYVGAGQALVHFIDVRDLARAFRIAEQRSDLHNSVYIIGGRKAVPLAAVANEIAAVFDVRKPWLHVPIKPLQLLGSLCEAVCTPLHIDPPLYRRRVDFFTKNRSFDCRKAETELGFFSTQSIHEEIVDIANSYIVSGEVARQALSAPGTIIRDITGSIRSIDESAERLYGYSQAGVTGKIIHTLLRTVFPVPLDRINAELKEKGIWVGNLVHQTSTGEQIRVFSRWELKHSESGEDLVQESHYARGISRTNSTGISERLASVGSFIAGMLLCGRTLL
jgi:PAS domain-containing protein